MENKTKIEGFVENLSDLIQIRRTTKPDLLKIIMSLITEDGQRLFLEVRDTQIKELQREGVEKNSYIEVTFIFEGSEKDNKRYNNLVVQNLKRLK